jgi:predicted nucleic acid-binding protein
MQTRLFLDTNIIIDFLFKRAPFDQEAKQLFGQIAQGKFEALVPTHAFPFLFYLLTKSLHSKEKAWETIAQFRQLVKVVPLEANAIDLALSSSFQDLEDAVQYQCACLNDAHYFVTRNGKDFKNSSIPVLTAKELLLRTI